MRKDLMGEGAEELHYIIRKIVAIAEVFEKLGIPIYWENIGDPNKKGETLPNWMKQVIKAPFDGDEVYCYSPTQGVKETREFLAERTNARGGVQITADDILFFNGLGDAISKIYQLLSPAVRVIGPSPSYSTHSSAEAHHANAKPLLYPLDPENKWYPDLGELYNHLKYNDSIAGILVINPNNPTGAVYPLEVLEEIVSMAKKFDQFLVFDEIYKNLVFNGNGVVALADVIKDVCGISLQGTSKETPWPGGRCGWAEFYNRTKDLTFERYVQKLIDKKMLEVCSTTHPQMVIPALMGNPRYEGHIQKRNDKFKERADVVYDVLGSIDGIILHKPEGAFYVTTVFKEHLKDSQSLIVDNKKAKEYLDKITPGVEPDLRFVYYLLAATGICVVPLTGFDSELHGFRSTLLETDLKKLEQTYTTIGNKIEEYLHS